MGHCPEFAPFLLSIFAPFDDLLEKKKPVIQRFTGF
jgi:hypothetical protein